jgi:hypothetical protein
MYALMMLAVAGCSDDPAPTEGATDTAPTVSGTTPAGGATDVARDAGIVITFSEPVAVAGAWFAIVCTTSGSHSAAASGGPQSFSVNPDADFAGGESCTVTVLASQVSDQDADDPPDNMAANYAWSFTTAASDVAPMVSGTTPAAAATDVALNTGIVITFSEPVDVAGAWFAILCTTSGTHTATVNGGPLIFSLNPDAGFAASETCTVTVLASQVSDQDADDPPDNMAANHAWSFTTAAGEVAPMVSSTTPAAGATDVARDAGIVITFSEPVDVGGAWFGIVCATSGTHSAAASGGPQSFSVNPDVDFAAGETCTVTVLASQVSDQDADDPPDNMAADYAWSFTTVSAAAMASRRATSASAP